MPYKGTIIAKIPNAVYGMLPSVLKRSMFPNPCRRGSLPVGKTKRGKGTKIMAITDAAGLAVAAHVESASPHEVKLVEATIDSHY